MDNEGDTMTVEAIEWPFLKAQKEGGDPAVSGAGPSHVTEDDNGSGSNVGSDRYEIVVSNVVNADDLKQDGHGLRFANAIVGTDPNVTSVAIDGTATVSPGGESSQFETCLISNADLVALSGGTNGGTGEPVKIETLKMGHSINDHRIEYDGVQYSFDPSELAAAASEGNVTLASDPNDDQKLIRVYQTSMEDNDNKLITVYEIKPESLDGSNVTSIGDHDASGAGRDVLVEIVSTPEGGTGQIDGSSSNYVALTEPPGNLQPLPQHHQQIHQLQGGTLQLQPQLQNQPKRGMLSPEELQVQLGQSVPLPPEELAAVTNSAAHTVNVPANSNGPGGNAVAELRCTLCGFVSYSRDEIAAHCEEAHELFLCQACNLVFKKRASLMSHSRAKHNNHNLASYHGGTTPRTKKMNTPTTTFVSVASSPTISTLSPLSNTGSGTIRRGVGISKGVNNKSVKVDRISTGSLGSNASFTSFNGGLTNSSILSPAVSLPQHPTPPKNLIASTSPSSKTLTRVVNIPFLTQPNKSGGNLEVYPTTPTTTQKSLELMPDICKILAKNKAVMPNLATITSNNHAGSNSGSATSGGVTRKRKGGSLGAGGKKNQTQDWARTLSSQVAVGAGIAGNQPLVLDSRLSDPQTRNQFNSEFAKKITSHGVGPEIFGMSQERLPALKGTYRLDIKERPAENSDITNGNAASLASRPPSVPSTGDPANNGREMLYSYDIVDTGIMVQTDNGSPGCKIICGICNFSNARIENVLFHCEIDHKQYYCQNRRCQLGFSSWDSLMRHMKHTHRKEK